MHEKIVELIKSSPVGTLVQNGSTYNVFPHHIPDNAISEGNTKAITYSFVNSQVDYTQTTYTIRFRTFSNNYSECRDIAIGLKTLFNSKTLTDNQNAGLSSTVLNIVDLGLDVETGIYMSSVDILVKTALEI